MASQDTANDARMSTLPLQSTAAGERKILHEEELKQMICLERKRTERSGKPFLLMLLKTGEQRTVEKNGKVLASVLSALVPATRETDLIGWYQNERVVGVMFIELLIDDKNSVLSTILARVSSILRDNLTFEQFNQISISFHFFPDKWDHDINDRPSNPTLYPDLSARDNANRLLTVTKRVMDILGSALILTISAPFFLIIALAIKGGSKGPVFFRQQRVGQYGQSFTFLKFRSMYVNNNPKVHEEYVTQLIAGHAKRNPSNGNSTGSGVYKLTSDPRVTRVGAFLRRTSLDEFPQFWNVLRGEMSLVGPRPAIPYEVAAYQTWHRRRVLEVKPGITGLWQVNGRSRIKFDEMVRLDLRYARSWSPWLDIKILLQTPRAVLVGEGAY